MELGAMRQAKNYNTPPLHGKKEGKKKEKNIFFLLSQIEEMYLGQAPQKQQKKCESNLLKETLLFFSLLKYYY
jgi:hypothetical protein